MTPRPHDPLAAAVDEALRVRREADRFEAAWPRPPTAEPFPTLTWAALERQLQDLASPERARLVPGLLAPIRRWAACKPPEMVLREILCLASVVLEEPAPGE